MESQEPIRPTEPPPLPAPAAPPTWRGSAAAPAPRPQWPIVIGVICVVFGSFGALNGVIQCLSPMVQAFFPSNFGGAGPASSVMAVSQQYAPVQIVLGVLSTLVAALLGVGGGLLLQRRREARPVLLGWACVKLVLALVSVVMGIVVQVAVMAAISQPGGAGPAAAMPAGFMAVMMGLGMVVGLAWLAALPVFMLVWMSRAAVRAEIASWGVDAGAAAGPGAQPA